MNVAEVPVSVATAPASTCLVAIDVPVILVFSLDLLGSVGTLTSVPPWLASAEMDVAKTPLAESPVSARRVLN